MYPHCCYCLLRRVACWWKPLLTPSISCSTLAFMWTSRVLGAWRKLSVTALGPALLKWKGLKGREVNLQSVCFFAFCFQTRNWFITPVVLSTSHRELLILSTSPAFSANSKDTYTQATSHLFPTLLRWLRCSDRGTVLRVIRILGRLASVPENILSLDMMCPDDDLGFLVQLLCASETAVESLCTSKGQLPSCMRATPFKETSKVNAGVIEDFNDFSDLKIRDAVLETLLALVVPYSATLKERIASQPRCVHLIARIALRSCSKPKHDGFSKDAVSILSALSTEPRNRKHILPVVSNLSKAALSDEAIAGINCITCNI